MEPPLLLRILLPLASLSWLLLLLLARGSAGRCRQILVSPLLLACLVFVLFPLMLTALMNWIGLGCAATGVLGGIGADEDEWSRQPAAAAAHLIFG